MDDTVTFCFHGIGTPGRDLEPDEDGYWVRTDRFHRILDHLAERSGPRITFDDGNASDAEIALPALTERGLTATFFILAGRLDTPGSLTSAAVAELRRAGMTIGTHGMNHRIWRGMTPQTRQVELIDARDRIAEAAGAAVDEAACPLGGYDRRLLNDLRGLGYTRVHTSSPAPC
ncbi:MAG: polysaccharide deacetylase family protein [Kineosporiaceae bacterium]